MKKITLLVVAFVATMLMSVNAQLVLNGSFENWTDATTATSWKWVNSGGTISDAAPAAQITVGANISDFVEGSTSLRVTNPTATVKLFQQIQLEAGKTYTLSFSYKASHERFRIWSGFAPTAGSVGGIVFQTTNVADDPLRTKNGYFPIATDWKQESYRFTVPATPTLFQLEFRYYNQSGSEFGLDNVSLTEVISDAIGQVVANKGIVVGEVFYNLLGVKVAQPIQGQVYVKKTTYDTGLVETTKGILF